MSNTEQLVIKLTNYQKRIQRLQLIPHAVAFLVVILIFLLHNIIGKISITCLLALFFVVWIELFGQCIVAITYKSKSCAYRTIYKNEFVSSLLNDMFEHVKYSSVIGYTKYDITSMHIIKEGGYFRSEDLLCAEYKGVPFRYGEVVMEDSHKNNNSNIRYFAGRVFEFTYPKPIESDVYIYSKLFIYTDKSAMPSQTITTESEEFNSKFNIATYDPHTAFYLLTPQIIEQLNAIVDSLPNPLINTIVVRFNHSTNKLIIAYNCLENTLEPPGYKEIISIPKERQKIEKQMKPVTDFIDALKLDSELHKKGGL